MQSQVAVGQLFLFALIVKYCCVKLCLQIVTTRSVRRVGKTHDFKNRIFLESGTHTFSRVRAGFLSREACYFSIVIYRFSFFRIASFKGQRD